MPKIEKKFPVNITKEEYNKVSKEYKRTGKSKNYK